MRRINISAAADSCALTLGRRGESHITEVIFDFSAWVGEFGHGVISMLAKRAVDADAYPVVLTVDGSTATWIVSATDTAYEGAGAIEFIYTVGDKIVKSFVMGTRVLPDIGEPSTPPDPYETWLEQILAAAQRIEDKTAALSNTLSMFSLGATKRENGATRILNKITATKMCAPFGYFYDTSESKLRLYMAAAQFKMGAKYKYFALLNKNGGDAYELTIENAPTASQLSAPETDDNYKFRVNTAFTEANTVDVRFCAVSYDADGIELHRIYSAQYRYVLNNGSVTRSRFSTAKTAADEIIEVGLSYSAASADAFICPRADGLNVELLPAVSTNQSASWNMVVDDSSFNTGRCLATLAGDHTMYFGPTIEKAAEE